MGAQFKFNPGQIMEEKNVTPVDDSSVPNATFGGGTKGRLSNVLMVGTGGDVAVLFCDKTTSEVITGLVAGIWQSRKPFSHVFLTGTSALNIRVGATF